MLAEGARQHAGAVQRVRHPLGPLPQVSVVHPATQQQGCRLPILRPFDSRPVEAPCLLQITCINCTGLPIC